MVAMTPPLLTGFSPVIDDRAHMLILGSFPSVSSLATGEYYANPRNAFWRITGAVFGFCGTASSIANDFGALLADYPAIERVYFNGSAARRIFGTLVGTEIRGRVLPSTSPARAMAAPDKLAAWRVINSG